MLAATVKAGKKPEALKIYIVDQGRYIIMRKAVREFGSFTTVLEATVKEGKKPPALKIDLLIEESTTYFANLEDFC